MKSNLLMRLRHCGGRRKVLLTVFSALAGAGAVAAIIFYLVGEPKLYVYRGGMRMYLHTPHIHGICPECKNQFAITLEQFNSDFIWHGRPFRDGRHYGGFGYIFACPVCSADIRASVDFWGKRTRKHPFGEHTRVWSLDHETPKDRLSPADRETANAAFKLAAREARSKTRANSDGDTDSPRSLSSEEANPVSARLSTNEVIKIATATAIRNQIDPGCFDAPTVAYSHRSRLWTLLFDGKEPSPGNHFSVYVDDLTELGAVFPGL